MPPQGERKYAIVGLGVVPGPTPGRTPRSVQCESAWLAIEDAGLKREDIDGAVDGRTGGGAGDAASWVDPYPRHMALPINFYYSVGRGGAIGGLGIATALSFLDRGIANYVMMSTVALDLSRKYAGREQDTTGSATIGAAARSGREGYWGSPHGDVAAAAHHSWIAARHMAIFGSTDEQRGHIAVQTRAWANKNPEAKMYGRPMTLDDYMNSPYVARPYHLLDICLVSDNATTFIVTTAERARDCRKPPVWILGQGFGEAIEDSWWEKENYVRLPVKKAKEAAFGQAGISKIEEIDSVQFYDCFTGEVMFQIEDYGFAPKGQGGAWAAEGHMGPGGDHPINTSGGLLSSHHNSDNTGLAEAVRQVRGECGERQIPNCQTALSTGHGGEMLSPALCSIHSTTILGRD
jgi:acetyl-CoA acetyltransferase